MLNALIHLIEMQNELLKAQFNFLGQILYHIAYYTVFQNFKPNQCFSYVKGYLGSLNFFLTENWYMLINESRWPEFHFTFMENFILSC